MLDKPRLKAIQKSRSPQKSRSQRPLPKGRGLKENKMNTYHPDPVINLEITAQLLGNAHFQIEELYKNL